MTGFRTSLAAAALLTATFLAPAQYASAQPVCRPGSGTEYCECACLQANMHSSQENGDGNPNDYDRSAVAQCQGMCRDTRCTQDGAISNDGKCCHSGQDMWGRCKGN